MKWPPHVFGRAFSFILTQFTQKITANCKVSFVGGFLASAMAWILVKILRNRAEFKFSYHKYEATRPKEKSMESGSRMLCMKAPWSVPHSSRLTFTLYQISI